MSKQIWVEIPESAEMGRLIGKNGVKKKKLEDDLKKTLEDKEGGLIELTLVIETRQKNPNNSAKLIFPRDTPKEKVEGLRMHLETTISQSCSIPQSQLHSKISDIEADFLPELCEPNVLGETQFNPGEPRSSKVFNHINPIVQDFPIDPQVLVQIRDTLGISDMMDFALLTDSILKESLFLQELSWLKPVDRIKLQLLCEKQRAQLEHREREHDLDDQSQRTFSSFSSKTNSLVRRTSAKHASPLSSWRPYGIGPEISLLNADSDGSYIPAALNVSIVNEMTQFMGRNLEDGSNESKPHENRVTALIPLLDSKDGGSHLEETIREQLRRGFELAILWKYSAIRFETFSLLVSEWIVHGFEGLVARAYLQEAALLCKRLAFSGDPPSLKQIVFVCTDYRWEALERELDGMKRVAQAQGPFAEATHSVPLDLDEAAASRGSDRESIIAETGAGAVGCNDARSCYDATSAGLQERDERGYKAGGVVFVRVNAGRVEVLLCVEQRTGEGTVLMALGGQRDHHEADPCGTAVREFCEETASLLPERTVRSAVRHAETRKLWVGFGRYVLFVASAAATGMRDLLDKLPERYEHLRFRPFTSEADHLVWVPWNRVCAAVSARGPNHRSRVRVRIGRGSGSSLMCVGNFLQRLSTVPLVAEAITAVARTAVLDKADLINRLMEEMDKTHELLQRSDDGLARELLGDEWKLKLEAPQLPICSIFDQLKPTCEAYKKFKAALPPRFAQQIISIRSINFSCRRAEFVDARRRLEKEGKESKETEPLFHGTPERWRASAIATHGFNTTIVLNGRALGNGVYTSSDPQVCEGYAQTAGSILWLKGLVTKETRSNPPVFVFPDPKHILPEYIADLSASDVTEQQALQEAQSSRAEIIRQHEEEKKEFEAKEIKFKQEVIDRWRKSARNYVQSLERSLQFATEMDAEIAASSDDSSILCSWADEIIKIDREGFQFRARLPIYAHKPQIIDAVQKHHVTILTADTGSGKSTQLPQYLLDHVFPGTKSRIAVLQPRRVNAVALAARVSSERNGEVGDEIGYRLGRGESSASDETRIEFMTHGLFVQIAQDAQRLLRSYSAVILDEAHERSVDIDLSLGLLRNALQLAVGDDAGQTTFKVVVMSATVSPEQVQTFRRHLTPVSSIACSILDLPGHTFPVQIVYRGDLQPDPTVIGTGAVGSILGDYATELALDLLQKTSSGHILVFMPGESSIERAMRSSALVMSKRTKASGSPTNDSKSVWDIFRFWNVANTKGNDAENEHVEWKNGGFVVSVVKDENETGRGKGSKSSQVGSEQKRLVRVGFYPFHGKLTGMERDRVLRPRDDRMVVFATNVAETGLTIPNVRYVIDTGLERRVNFEADTGLSKMVTTQISQSSMNQRAGRAGRVASGVCIRLYSAETARAFPQSDPLEVEGTLVLGRALKLVALGSGVCLPDPISPEQLLAARNALRALGAVGDDGQLTAEVGQPLLKLGLDIRLGRFLLACDRFGCIEHGVRLAAIITTDAHQRLLPVRTAKESQAQSVQERLGDLLNMGGDHLTLIQIMIKYEKAHQKIEWCKKRGFDYASLDEAQRAKIYLLEVLAQLRLRLHNDSEKMDSNGGWERAVLRSLCAGYCDQLAVARKPGDCKEGFVRLLDDESKATAVASIDQFNLSHGRQPGPDDTGILLLDDGQQGDAPAAQPLTASADVRIRLGNTSALWTLSLLKSADGPVPKDRSLVVFTSAMLTDSRPEVPQANVMSYVSAQDVQQGAPSWCREAGFGKLYDSNVRHTIEYSLPSNASARLLKDYGKCLTQLRQKFPAIWLSFDKQKNVIKFSAPEGIIKLVTEKLDRLVSDMEQEEVEIRVPEQADMAKFIGKGGQHKNELENELKILAKEAGADPASLKLIVETVPASPRNAVKLRFEGSVKAIAGALIGRVQSDLIEACRIPLPQLRLGNTDGAVSASLQANPRLVQLSTSVPPPQWTGRDGAMLQLAHIVIWRCGCSVYGGFVRDWVVRGQPAVDIDALVQTGETDRVAGALVSAAASVGLACASQRVKGAARSLSFGDGRFGSPIDVDLVDPANVPRVSPGVDADIDNIRISAKGGLGRKVPGAAGRSLPLAKCVKHAQAGKFVFFYQLDGPSCDVALGRLRKLLSKNFVCVSPVPQAAVQLLSPDQQRLIRPKPKYSQRWWAGAQ